MLRSFVALGRNLNLTKSVAEIDVTRQTIRRHINDLEKLKGEKLFTLTDRQYALTEQGEVSLAKAENLLDRSASWFDASESFYKGMSNVALDIGDNRWLFKQQHPLNRVWSKAPPLLKRGLKDWGLAKGQLDDPAYDEIRPYVMVYRVYRDDWLCVEVGNSSSYATWLGEKVAKSSIGRNFAKDVAFAKVDHYLLNAYQFAVETGSHWYDHICASIPREPGGDPEPVNYQRLVSACTFPDGEPAALVLCARTNNLDIPGMAPEKFTKMHEREVMEFAI